MGDQVRARARAAGRLPEEAVGDDDVATAFEEGTGGADVATAMAEALLEESDERQRDAAAGPAGGVERRTSRDATPPPHA